MGKASGGLAAARGRRFLSDLGGGWEASHTRRRIARSLCPLHRAPRARPLTTEALEWKAALAASTGEPYDPVQEALSYRLDEIERAMGEPQAATLAAIAYGKGTPISALVEDYLREKAFRPRQAHEYARTIRGFEGWLQEEAKLAGTVESCHPARGGGLEAGHPHQAWGPSQDSQPSHLLPILILEVAGDAGPCTGGEPVAWDVAAQGEDSPQRSHYRAA